MRICICGGGALGHVCAAVFASKKGVELNILSGHPEQWHNEISVTDEDGKQYVAQINKVSSNPESVVVGQDIIFLCLPGFLIEQTLRNIKPFIGKAVVGSVVSSTGFFFFAHDILGEEAKLFGFQRVPFISRVIEYGKSASLLGYKKSLSVVLENVENRDSFLKDLERLFLTPIKLLSSFYEVALSNSNPILHTGRLYTLFNGREDKVFDHNILFYKEWTDEASLFLIEMDNEFFQLLGRLNVHSIPSLLDYYECKDAPSLTRKIQSIPAFHRILSPMSKKKGGWLPDFKSRYFIEEFPYRLWWIKDMAISNFIKCPTIDEVYQWGMRVKKD